MKKEVNGAAPSFPKPSTPVQAMSAKPSQMAKKPLASHSSPTHFVSPTITKRTESINKRTTSSMSHQKTKHYASSASSLLAQQAHSQTTYPNNAFSSKAKMTKLSASKNTRTAGLSSVATAHRSPFTDKSNKVP
jgi:hypothetical protein